MQDYWLVHSHSEVKRYWPAFSKTQSVTASQLPLASTVQTVFAFVVYVHCTVQYCSTVHCTGRIIVDHSLAHAWSISHTSSRGCFLKSSINNQSNHCIWYFEFSDTSTVKSLIRRSSIKNISQRLVRRSKSRSKLAVAHWSIHRFTSNNRVSPILMEKTLIYFINDDVILNTMNITWDVIP